MKLYAPWTDQEIEILKTLTEQGFTANEVVTVLKSRTYGAVKNKMQDLGISVPVATPEIDMAAFKDMVKNRRNPKCL